MYYSLSRTRLVASFAALSILMCAFYFSLEHAQAAVVSNLLPSSEGTFMQFTPSTGATHYTLVDEASCNGTTDFNSTTVVGRRDSYGVNLASVPTGAVITQIAIAPCASRVSQGSANPVMKVFYRLNGVNSADSGAYALVGTVPSSLPTTTFSGLSVTKNASTTLQLGAVLTSGTKGVRLSRISTNITYTFSPAAPSAVSAAASAIQPEIQLLWTDNATNETWFVIERKVGAGAFTTLATTSANATTYADTSVSAATTYTYRVRALNSDGYSAYSNEAPATTGQVPVTTGGFAAASVSTADISLSWNDGADETSYVISRRTNGEGAYTVATTTTADVVSYLDSGLVGGTTYDYRIAAVNGYGTSAYSYATATLGSVPAAPTNFIASATSTQMYLSWSPVSGADGYLIERHTGSSSFSFIATTTGTSYYDSANIIPGEIYYYRISAFNGFGSSPFAFAWSAAGGPSAPTNLTASYVGSTTPSVLLGWTDTSTSETGFHIFRSSNGVNYSFLGTASANITSYTDSTVLSGTWHYRLFAYNANGASVYTNVATVVVP